MRSISFSMGILALSLITGGALFASDEVDDVINLQKAGVDQEVILAFVKDSPTAYNPTADEIQSLEDAGVSATIIVGMLDRAKEAGGNAQIASAPDATTADNANPAPVTDTATATGVTAPPDDQADTTLFYEALAPDGNWSQDPTYGYSWTPTVSSTDPNWRPYANDGHWAYTDHGWYWESNYNWGWAAFHYGRWHNNENRWSWVPDNTWGPAWVDWRQSDNYYGWAPLPPGSRFEAGVGFSFNNAHVGADFNFGLGERDYAFVQSDRFLDVNLGVALVPESHRHNAFTETKIVNNTYVYNDNRIVNNGVPVAAVSRATKREIKPVVVADASVKSGQAIPREQRQADKIVAYRPKVANNTTVDPKTAIARHQAAARTQPQRTTANPAQTSQANTAALRVREKARVEQALTHKNAATPTAVRNPAASEAEKNAQARLVEEKAKRKETTAQPARNVPPATERRAEPATERKVEPAPVRRAEPAAERKVEPAPVRSAEPAAERKVEPAPVRRAEPAVEPKVEPAPVRRPEPAAERKVEPAPVRRAEPAAERKVEPAPVRSAEPAAERRAEPAAERRAEPAAERRAEPAAAKAPEKEAERK